MFFTRLEYCSHFPPYETGYTYVERLPRGRLCYVRKRHGSYRTRSSDTVEVYEEEPERAPCRCRNDPTKRPIRFHEHHHDHHHFIHHEGPCRDDVRLEIREGPDASHGSPETPTTPCHTPISPVIEERCPRPEPTSPLIEIREPNPAKMKVFQERGAVRIKKVPVEKVRLEKVRLEKARGYERFVKVKLPSRHPRPSPIPPLENPVWDENLGAYVIRRTPRVRFA
ncbi:uncharacterized protein Z518_09419 [Rhinocladiella mackenziei CBS 650.93]|uniref:Uncharacterized protein n=1 Tax=Rhinocladiella mackenziei CBS 650.93 TaxID=1442369 RepID=A0A0D2GTN6_9EURO|nr:uncharacterized protein Z518_09419 [Rhinocladiella mackenziei CBS 650.93]KIX01693.1 hypothetical protein Z518_09419 [Rhinocladiella mackenziei CBS 650.93]